jgi:hypothetical protein
VHDDVGRLAEQARADHDEDDAADRQHHHDHQPQPLGPEDRAEAANGRAELLAALDRDGDTATRPEWTPSCLAAGGGENRLFRRLAVALAVRADLAHAATSACWEATISAYVPHV